MSFNLKEMLKNLSNASDIGEVFEAEDIVLRYLSEFADCRRLKDGSLAAELPSSRSETTLLLDAHIDEVGFIVTHVTSDGFLRLSPIGGIDARMLPAQRITVLSGKPTKAVFCSTPPHLKSKEQKVKPLDELFADTGLSKKAAEIIAPGDVAVFSVKAAELYGDTVCGKAMDNRAGVAVLLGVAETLKNKELPVRVCMQFSRMEELGLRGAKTAAYDIDPDFAVCVDTTFGSYPNIPPHKTGDLGRGPMLGVSPILSGDITARLKRTAAESGIPLQFEVMGGKTGTNADVISLNRKGVPTGLLSVPIRSMHTPAETVQMGDIEAAVKLLSNFILNWEDHHA